MWAGVRVGSVEAVRAAHGGRTSHLLCLSGLHEWCGVGEAYVPSLAVPVGAAQAERGLWIYSLSMPGNTARVVGEPGNSPAAIRSIA